MDAPPAVDCATIVRKALAVVAPQFRLSLHHGAHGVAHDADRLDLSRVGITPEPRYLCTE